jgi:hypothetical protein
MEYDGSSCYQFSIRPFCIYCDSDIFLPTGVSPNDRNTFIYQSKPITRRVNKNFGNEEVFSWNTQLITWSKSNMLNMSHVVLNIEPVHSPAWMHALFSCRVHIRMAAESLNLPLLSKQHQAYSSLIVLLMI